ncbi:MAG: pyruvate kinase [Thermoguttaceae bacterium]|nr:pyruvate kinase [Thermoguttaceae bacterium]MDW8039022.1 pyruvate kinase [Thermoguttaceae bacterium]
MAAGLFHRTTASYTKIVATVGPACRSVECLAQLIQAGVDVFRINTAHGQLAEHTETLARIRQASQQVGQPVAVLVDLAGPKIRLGDIPGGQLHCLPGQRLRFVRSNGPLLPGELTTTYPRLIEELQVGDRLMLADGTVGLVVRSRSADYVECEVVQPGILRSRQGVNLPWVKLSLPALSEADVAAARWAAQQGADFLGLSFVRRPEDVAILRDLLQGYETAPQIVAKIEKPEALQHLEAIVQAADAVMVARGDLGVETDIAQIAVVQKQIVAACRRWRRPVIIATQMLESMTHEQLPTRAEATDVANAILDGADACMLSAETAIGQYPVAAVQMMHRIALATEPFDRPHWSSSEQPPDQGLDPVTEATARAAGQLAEQLRAKILLVATATGATALCLSKYRFRVPVWGASPSEAVLRRMCLYWGVVPLPGAPIKTSAELLTYAIQKGRQLGQLQPGDRLVLLTGSEVTDRTHNMIQVHTVSDGAF